MPVLDASVLVEYLAGGEHAAQSRARLLRDDNALWAPHLVDAEIGYVLRRAVLAGALRPSTAHAALRDLADLPLRLASHIGLLERAWALRATITFYDALCVALAERLDMPLLTLDGRLHGAAGVRAAVHVLVACRRKRVSSRRGRILTPTASSIAAGGAEHCVADLTCEPGQERRHGLWACTATP